MIGAGWPHQVRVLPGSTWIPRAQHRCTISISPWQGVKLVAYRVDGMIQRVFVTRCERQTPTTSGTLVVLGESKSVEETLARAVLDGDSSG